jgi:hypothetical protein
MLQMMSLERITGGVKIIWEVADETDALEYRLFRAGAGNTAGSIVGTVPAGGRSRYEFIDTDVPLDRTCRYTLIAVERDRSETFLGSRELAARSAAPLSLAQNLPNPFNPQTTITFTVPEPVRVHLAVFDARGKLVNVLLDKPLNEGRHEARWNGDDHAGRAAPSGVYFYRLRAGKQVLTKKMILLK